LLPFRVWQIFNAMVGFAAAGKAAEFVCAAGTLTHYVGDACQPLHISYLHDGDPERTVKHKLTKGDREGETEQRAFGTGVHAAYEDSMVSAFRDKVLDALKETPTTTPDEMITTGLDAAKLTIAMMRATFKALPPMSIVEAFAEFDGKPKDRAEHLWKKFGAKTLKSMQSGSHLLAVLWESAWLAGGGETRVKSTRALTEEKAMEICADPDFIPSVGIAKIGPHL
jgi:hypothetical protein